MGLKREERKEGALVIDSKGAIFGEVISKVAVRVINRSRTLHHLLLLSCTSSMRSVNATSQHQSHTEMGGVVVGTSAGGESSGREIQMQQRERRSRKYLKEGKIIETVGCEERQKLSDSEHPQT